MSAAPETTVIIPTRDRWSLLQTTLRTALSQEEVTLEVIVVDDGSTDETSERLSELTDARLRVIRHASSRGVAAARNSAIAAARGEWLAFLDDDDLWSPKKLRTQLATATAHGAAWTYSAALVVDERRAILDTIEAPEPDGLIKRLLPYNPLPAGASNVLARTDVVRELGGYDESLSQLADWDMWIRLAATGGPAACPEPLIAYVQHEGGMLLSDRVGVVDEFERLAAKHDALTAEHGVELDRAGLVRWIAWADSRAGARARAARGYFRAGVMYARKRTFWMSRASFRDAAGAVFGQVLTDTGRRPVHEGGADAPAWLRLLP
jgi:glycosyltransferase involved in cell wall biosynthesis